jgi:16S rRNA (cytosine967-C5)-methyltransferase
MMMSTTERDLAPVSAALRPGPLRDTVLGEWQKARIDWAGVAGRLRSVGRDQRWLGSRERRLLSELVYGLIRHLRRIDEGLRRLGQVSGSAAPDLARLVALALLEYELPPDEAQALVPGLDWPRLREVDEALGRERDPVRRIGLRHSLPDWLVERLVAEQGAEAAEAFATALNQRAPLAVRVNTLRATVAEVAEELAGVGAVPGRLAGTALLLAGHRNAAGLAPYQRGAIEVQDEGSQLVAELLAAAPGQLVVDLCAGAGGKTLAVAAAMQNRGRLLAVDVDERKLHELRRRARRAGVNNVQTAVVSIEARDAWPAQLEQTVGRAARVLADVPCSGLGALRRHPELRWRLSPADLERLPVQQLDIARRGAELLAPGGWLVYATCTVLAAENQAVVERLLRERRDLELVPLAEVLGPERGAAVSRPGRPYLELWPQVHGCDGFFAALLRRRDSSTPAL